MGGTDRPTDQAEKAAREVWRLMLLPPEQRQKERREKLERKIREQPEKVAEEGVKRGALRFFLCRFRKLEPRFLAELRESSSGRSADLKKFCERYHVPPTIAVAIECSKTSLMWQAFPDLPNVWHFERPEGALADPLRPATAAGPWPFVFVAAGWNSAIETLAEAKRRLRQQFNATLNDRTTFWKAVEIDRTELLLFEESPSHGKLRRTLEHLAEKQAIGKASYRQIAERLDLTKEAVRRRILDASNLIELPEIRRSPPGAPKGKRPRK